MILNISIQFFFLFEKKKVKKGHFFLKHTKKKYNKQTDVPKKVIVLII